MSEIVNENIEGMTAAEQRTQMILRQDRLYEAQFASQISIETRASALEAATKLVTQYAEALTAAGFPEIGAQVLKVVVA